MGSGYWTPDYWTPDYWAPDYWAQPDGVVATPPAEAAAGRDTTVLRDVEARLRATGAFDAVWRFSPDEWPRPAAQAACAFVESDRWGEDDELGDHTYTRRLHFKLTLIVRDEDPVARAERLDWLYNVAANALVGRQLAGFCLPVRTIVGEGTYTRAAPPERGLQCPGTCVYLVAGTAARDATDPEGY